MSGNPAMHAAPPPWDLDALRRALAARLPDVAVEVVAQVESTSSALVERARAARGTASPPWLLVAERQTAGRGRLGRSWQSAPGASLTFSLAWPLARGDASGLSLAVGAAIADALDAPRDGRAPRLLLKWPNDVWLADAAAAGGGRKLGGILVELVAAEAARVAVLGVGLNVAPVAAAGLATACLRELDAGATPQAALEVAAPALVAALRAFDAAGFAPFAGAFARRDLLAGRPVATTDPALAEGMADGVADDGALRVRRADGTLGVVRSGEVSVRPGGRGDAPAC